MLCWLTRSGQKKLSNCLIPTRENIMVAGVAGQCWCLYLWSSIISTVFDNCNLSGKFNCFESQVHQKCKFMSNLILIQLECVNL